MMRVLMLLLPAAALAICAQAGMAQEASRPNSAIVEEAVRAAEQAQARDEGKVEQMSEDAAKAVEGAPSGAEAVGSTATPAQASVRPPEEEGAPTSPRELIGRTLTDRDGQAVGQVRDVLPAGREGEGGLVLVQLQDGDGQVKGVHQARVLPGERPDGPYRLDLDHAGLLALPTYRQNGASWEMVE